jgi:cyanophycinase
MHTELFQQTLYLKAFGKIGCDNIGIIHIKNRNDADNPEYIERIKNCDGVMFSGGNQLRLTTILGGTELMQIIHHRYETESFVVAGTSAGAMAMSNTMIYHGNSTTAHLKGEVRITTGLAFIKDVIIDSHFEKTRKIWPFGSGSWLQSFLYWNWSW